MLCFELDENHALVRGIDKDSFYAPQFAERIQEASVRIIAGADFDLEALAAAIKNNIAHALLCCLTELIPTTGNTKSSIFPPETCLLSIDVKDIADSPNDKSVLFASEGSRRLYGCRPGSTAIRTAYHDVIVHNGKELELVSTDPLEPDKRSAYEQYNGQNISVLELL